MTDTRVDSNESNGEDRSLKNRMERRNGRMRIAATMAQLSAMGAIPMFPNGVKREHAPWESVQLSKAERKGKTPEEIEEMRKIKWARQEDSGELS